MLRLHLPLRIVFLVRVFTWRQDFMVSTFLSVHVLCLCLCYELYLIILQPLIILDLNPLRGIGTLSMLCGYFCLSLFTGGAVSISKIIPYNLFV